MAKTVLEQPFQIVEEAYDPTAGVKAQIERFVQSFGYSPETLSIQGLALIIVRGGRDENDNWAVTTGSYASVGNAIPNPGRLLIQDAVRDEVLPIAESWIRNSRQTLFMPGHLMEIDSTNPDHYVAAQGVVQTKGDPVTLRKINT